jgi:hypothetical protein
MTIPIELVSALVILVLVVVFAAMLRGLLSRRKPRRLPPIDLSIDLNALAREVPAALSPRLTYQSVPVRLAAVVLAPAGRAQPLPPAQSWPQIFEALHPGFSRVVDGHRPLVRPWPPQLSDSGFAHRFFAELKLPTLGREPLEWSAVAGPVRFQDRTILVGLVFHTSEATTLGADILDSPVGWRRVLEVK